MGEEFIIQSTATETHQPISPNLMGQTQEKQKTFAPAILQARGNAVMENTPSILIPVYQLQEGGEEAAAGSEMGAH